MLLSTLLVGFSAAVGVGGREELDLIDLSPECAPSRFSPQKLAPDVSVRSINVSRQLGAGTSGGIHGLPSVADLNFCKVEVSLNHHGSDNDTRIEVWLPLLKRDWNGRFQGTGGAGFATGIFDPMLGPAVNNGYAASSTDGGYDGAGINDLSWALKPDDTVNWDLLHAFASRSLAEQVIVGKSVAEQYYGEKPRFSYWNGCSQGGRQGYALAQKYPGLLDGILANAPAISLTDVVMGDFWPQLVMKEAGIWMSSCEFDYFRQKAMEACDMLDGVSDGVIAEPELCDFDPLHVIGKTFYCDGKEVEVNAAMAEVVRRIEQGPRTPFKSSIWHGFPMGTGMHYLANITGTPEGVRGSNPFIISTEFIQRLLVKDTSFNVTKLTYGDFMALWAQASYEYGWLLDADEPDLSRFQESGGKLLTWHGISDPVISYQNTVRYRERVEKIMGGAQKVDGFYRLFLAPGVEHCAGGAGPVPLDPLAALVDWVEKDEAPETLDAGAISPEGDLITRDLCAYPGRPKYMGLGDAKRASTWSCVGGPERPAVDDEMIMDRENELKVQDASKHRRKQKQKGKVSDRAGEILGGLQDRLEGLGMGFRIG